MNKIDLSIIIVNYNGKHYLEECLRSIGTCCASFSYEVIIVDNNSSDGSQEFIKTYFPEAHLFEHDYNAGFAKGNNLGARIAKGKVLLLLNNDVILLNDLTSLLNKAKQDEVGAIGIKMLDKDKNYQVSVGKFPGIKELIFFSKLFRSDTEFVKGMFTKEFIDVDWVQGSFLMVKREDYIRINGLDESYFMYVEDLDFCKKMAQIGKKNLFNGNISYIHFGGFNKSRQPLLIDGYIIYVNKHFKRFKNVATFILNLKRVLLKIIT